MNIHLINILFIFVFVSCTGKGKSKYDPAYEVLSRYFDIENIEEGDVILVFSKNTGCISCRNWIKSNYDSFLRNPRFYILTNHNVHFNNNKNLVFDSLDLLDVTDMGFIGPSIITKRKNNFEFVFELNGLNKDSFDFYLSKIY